MPNFGQKLSNPLEDQRRHVDVIHRKHTYVTHTQSVYIEMKSLLIHLHYKKQSKIACTQLL